MDSKMQSNISPPRYSGKEGKADVPLPEGNWAGNSPEVPAVGVELNQFLNLTFNWPFCGLFDPL